MQSKISFKKCMELMRKSDSQLQEDGFHYLTKYVDDHIENLIEEFNTENDLGLKCWLLELIGMSKSPKAFEVLKENINNKNDSLRHWVIEGLKNINTKDSRRLLFELKQNNNQRI